MHSGIHKVGGVQQGQRFLHEADMVACVDLFEVRHAGAWCTLVVMHGHVAELAAGLAIKQRAITEEVIEPDQAIAPPWSATPMTRWANVP